MRSVHPIWKGCSVQTQDTLQRVHFRIQVQK